PAGGSLTHDEWSPRHRAIVAIAFAHVPLLGLIAIANGLTFGHVLVEAIPIVVTAAVAAWPRVPRRLRSLAATVSLVTSSAVLVHVTGGLIESHFHFFVVVAIVMLYQDWTVFLVAFAYVVLHHGITGTIAPENVYNHAAAWERPLLWGMIHGTYIAAASIAGLVTWHYNEQERERTAVAAAQLARTVDHLAHTNLRLEQAAHARDEFLSRVSHELRTPLTAVGGFAETLRSRTDLDPERLREGIDAIARNAVRLERLIDDLLHAGQIDGGHSRPRPEVVRVGDVVDDALDELGGAVEVSTPGADLRVVVDPTHLRQVLTNLLTNASRYGEPPITVTATPQGTDHVKVAVRDHGAGIPPDFVPDMFDRFAQASTGDQRTAHGVGLGLWIAQSLAALNGGSLRHERPADGGACFVITLPAPSTE
ncbi:MAG: HAMP domain-containing sensor histidine kinase, partial [Nitriliruptoraceae bacterium]